MKRAIFDVDHDDFRAMVRAFCEDRIVPHYDRWEAESIVPRELWLAAGELGLLGFMMPVEFSGGGVNDFRYHAVLQEELIRAGATGVGVGFGVHADVVSAYLLSYATEEQKARWMPGFCSGELIGAIAMTEPSAGSDLKAVATTAVRDDDHYVLNGSKTFISNGLLADLVLVVCKTDPAAGTHGVSLLAVERGMAGFTRGRKLDKIGLKSQDTAELFFDDVRVPIENLIGVEGEGFGYLMERLPQERLAISVRAAAACRRMLDLTLDYVTTRKAFGERIGSFQHARFLLAELETEQRIAQTFVDRSIQALNDGDLTAADAAMGKWWTTELETRTADRCLQLHGGYGYMAEYPIARAFLDSRVQTIYGGTTEIMKEIIGRDLGL